MGLKEIIATLLAAILSFAGGAVTHTAEVPENTEPQPAQIEMQEVSENYGEQEILEKWYDDRYTVPVDSNDVQGNISNSVCLMLEDLDDPFKPYSKNIKVEEANLDGETIFVVFAKAHKKTAESKFSTWKFTVVDNRWVVKSYETQELPEPRPVVLEGTVEEQAKDNYAIVKQVEDELTSSMTILSTPNKKKMDEIFKYMYDKMGDKQYSAGGRRWLGHLEDWNRGTGFYNLTEEQLEELKQIWRACGVEPEITKVFSTKVEIGDPVETGEYVKGKKPKYVYAKLTTETHKGNEITTKTEYKRYEFYFDVEINKYRLSGSSCSDEPIYGKQVYTKVIEP